MIERTMNIMIKTFRFEQNGRHFTGDISFSNTFPPIDYTSILVQSFMWRHQKETFSALLALCYDNPMVAWGFPSQRPVMGRFDVFFDLRLQNRLSKHSRRRWFETPSRSLRLHCSFDFVPNMRPFITGTNGEPVHWRHTKALDNNEDSM